MENRCWEYLKPLLDLVILMRRNWNNEYLLSELGDQVRGYIGALVYYISWLLARLT